MKTINIKTEYLILIFFTIASILYINIDKLPLTHPGNLKAADAFYHALIVEGILNTKQWNYFDIVFSLGQEKALNVQPPLEYINSAILSTFSTLPPWITLYFLMSLSQAFFIILIYLISKEVFENENIAILSSAMYILPFGLTAWLYGLWIGLWPQLSGYLFILLYLWSFIRYLKKEENWALIILGLSISSVLLTHPMDLAYLILPTIILSTKIILKNIKNIKEIIKKFFFIGLIPSIMIFAFLPRILFQWRSQGSEQFVFGFFGFPCEYFGRCYLNGLVFPDILFLFPGQFSSTNTILLILDLFMLLILILSTIQLIINFKKYKRWLLICLYYFIIIYLFPIITKGPHYYGRFRAITPIFILPIIAYGLYNFIIIPLSKYRLSQKIIVLILSVILIISGSFEYMRLINLTKYEHISLEEWNAYKWIHENTKETDIISFFGSIFQAEFVYSKRKTFNLNMEDYIRVVNEFIATNQTPTKFKGFWGGDNLRTTARYEISFWKYEKYDEPNKTMDLEDLDYILFQDISPEIANVNHFFINEYITKYNFSVVYNRDGYIIIKNNLKSK